jgi:LacI family transcriptional regulator
MDIKSLARELGLSTSTVSRALNGYSDVNEATRQRIQHAAKTLGYRANIGARRLVRGSTEAVGIVYSAGVENLGNPQFLDMAGGLSERLHADHFDLMLAVASDEMDLDIYDRLFRGGRVDAVVLPNTRVNDARVNYLMEKGYPFLAYGRTGQCSDYSWFDFDNEEGSKVAVRHLVDLGHQRIAYVHSPLELNFAQQRLGGFRQALEQASLPFDPSRLAGPAVDRRSGRAAVQTLMARTPAPTAVVVDNNLGGIGVLRGLMERGFVLGRDVSVVVHGVIPNDSLLAVLDATMVTQPTAHSTGVCMAEMVLSVLREPGMGPLQVLRQPELVVGQTTGI